MKIDFFEKEFRRVWRRFNQTFGQQTVCNLSARYRVIISIIQMGMLGEKINEAKDKAMVRDDIQMFIRIRNTLNIIFDNAENYWHERRRYEKGNHRNRQDYQKRSVKRKSGTMQKVREPIHSYMA
jgi:hypothetical protein